MNEYMYIKKNMNTFIDIDIYIFLFGLCLLFTQIQTETEQQESANNFVIYLYVCVCVFIYCNWPWLSALLTALWVSQESSLLAHILWVCVGIADNTLCSKLNFNMKMLGYQDSHEGCYILCKTVCILSCVGG